MKKSLKNLSLNKKTISKFQVSSIVGGTVYTNNGCNSVPTEGHGDPYKQCDLSLIHI